MLVSRFLQDRQHEILTAAAAALSRAQVGSYQKLGPEPTQRRLEELFNIAVLAVDTHDLGRMIGHADAIAGERFAAGYDLWEVQTAFNVLEEAMWIRIIKDLAPSELAEALGLVSTVLGAGKDALARRYVALATKTKAPSLNLASLFTGGNEE
jgi:hypothetical protein